MASTWDLLEQGTDWLTGRVRRPAIPFEGPMPPPEMRSYSPGPIQRAGDVVQQGMMALGADPYHARRMAEGVVNTSMLFPPIGIGMGMAELKHTGETGGSPADYALAGLGAIPGTSLATRRLPRVLGTYHGTGVPTEYGMPKMPPPTHDIGFHTSVDPTIARGYAYTFNPEQAYNKAKFIDMPGPREPLAGERIKP